MGGVAVLLHLAESGPAFDYDAFFRACAHSWAQTITPNYACYCGTCDGHPLLCLRVNVTVRQFEEFYAAYGITEGDGMYRPRRTGSPSGNFKKPFLPAEAGSSPLPASFLCPAGREKFARAIAGRVPG